MTQHNLKVLKYYPAFKDFMFSHVVLLNFQVQMFVYLYRFWLLRLFYISKYSPLHALYTYQQWKFWHFIMIFRWFEMFLFTILFPAVRFLYVIVSLKSDSETRDSIYFYHASTYSMLLSIRVLSYWAEWMGC